MLQDDVDGANSVSSDRSPAGKSGCKPIECAPVLHPRVLLAPPFPAVVIRLAKAKASRTQYAHKHFSDSSFPGSSHDGQAREFQVAQSDSKQCEAPYPPCEECRHDRDSEPDSAPDEDEGLACNRHAQDHDEGSDLDFTSNRDEKIVGEPAIAEEHSRALSPQSSPSPPQSWSS